jgi:hypothetical protein
MVRDRMWHLHFELLNHSSYEIAEGYFVSLAFSYVSAAFLCHPGLSFKAEMYYD